MKIKKNLSLTISFNEEEALEIQQLFQEVVKKCGNMKQKDIFHRGLESILAEEDLKNTVEK